MSDVAPNLVQRIESVWRHGPKAERDELIYGIVRYISKLGQLSVADIQLRAMHTFFSIEDAVELYQLIRDGSLRFEGEWRSQFLAYFPAARDALPPQRTTEEEYNEWLRTNGADT